MDDAPHPASDRALQWASLRRESIALRHAPPGAPAVGYVAGEPELPEDFAWPLDGRDRPLEHLLTLDLAALPRIGIDLPEEGRLLFFVDDEYEEPELVFLERTARLRARPYPEAFPHRPEARIALTAVVEPAWPAVHHPYLSGLPRGYFDGVADWDAQPEPPGAADHRIGGYHAVGAQYDFPCAPGSAIPELLHAPDGEAKEDEDPVDWLHVPVEDPLDLPILLAKLDYDPDAGMSWGDCGSSEWTIGREDLAARRFDKVEFSWSCH